jgi:LytR cell envelope-related transcriptional attenuator
VTLDQPPGGPVRATRTARRDDEHRRRRIEAVVTVLVVVVVGLYARSQADTQAPGARAGQTPTSTSTASPSSPAGSPRFLAISVTGAPEPLLAVVGIGSVSAGAAAVAVPMGLTVVVPGAGEMRAKDLGTLPGRSIEVALSNLIGSWARHYLVTDVDRFAAMVDAAGGLHADLAQGFVLPSAVVGPGPVTLTGAQVKGLLVSTQGVDAQAAWKAVLTAWLGEPRPLERGDVADTDDLQAASAALEAARGATVLDVPTKTVAGTTSVIAQPAFDALVTKTFGTAAPVPVIVQNGNGRPGIGQAVARRILLAGFRVVISENAPTFGVVQTTITANGRKHVAQARRLRHALGVGRLRLSRVPSGIGDITVVVGEDFTA